MAQHHQNPAHARVVFVLLRRAAFHQLHLVGSILCFERNDQRSDEASIHLAGYTSFVVLTPLAVLLIVRVYALRGLSTRA